VKRNNYAAYIDLGLGLSPRWYLGAAARFEHYDDESGNTASFKLNSRYELSDTVAVRGTCTSLALIALDTSFSSLVVNPRPMPQFHLIVIA